MSVPRLAGPPRARSLAARLLLGSTLATLSALVLVLVLMDVVLTRFVTGQIDQRLDNKIVALATQVRVAVDGTLSLDGGADGPPFDKPRHHSFWMVRGPRNTLATGWLAATDFDFPAEVGLRRALSHPRAPAPAPGVPTHPRSVDGVAFDGVAMHERVARATIAGVVLTILVAAPATAVAGPVSRAMAGVGLAVSVLGIALAALAFLLVRLGLGPVTTLRRHVTETGEGRRDLLPTDQPREVAPLVEEVNRLLERNAANLEEARRHVANLAHGLKTPLAALQLGVDRLDVQGKEDLALLLTQIDLRVRHHLARARRRAGRPSARPHGPRGKARRHRRRAGPHPRRTEAPARHRCAGRLGCRLRGP